MNISTDDDVVCMCESTCYMYGCQLYFQLLISISMYGNCPSTGGGSGVVLLLNAPVVGSNVNDRQMVTFGNCPLNLEILILPGFL